jgi:hypothetical protein
MARKTYNSSTWDDMVGSTAISGLTNNVTFAGISSTGFTAPNLVNQANGAWICVASQPSVSNSGNLVVELLESGVVKASGTINYADILLGFHYVRFTTPYTWATLTASAYTIRIRNTVSSGSLGQVNTAASGPWSLVTYDTASSLGTTDDPWVGGFIDAGITAKTLTLSGTSNQFGSGTDKAMNASTQLTMGAGLTIGVGATVVYDQTASTTVQVRGSVFVGRGSVFDMRPPSSNKAIISTLMFDCETANGNYLLVSPPNGRGGQILTPGAPYDQQTTFASGVGTAANPLIVQTGWDAGVGDEIVIGGGTDYAKNEVRYIITRNSSTSFVLSNTKGGSENALTQTHAVGAHIANLTRNSVVTALTTTRGYYVGALHDSTAGVSSFDNTRFEYVSCTSGHGFQPTNSNNTNTFDNTVFYKSPISGRGTVVLAGLTTARTFTGITLYDQYGANFGGQSGVQVQTCSNQTFEKILDFNAPSGTTNCGMISLIVSSVNNTFNNCHAYGCNAINSTAGYAIGIFSSSGNVFNNCTVNGNRQNAVYLATGTNNVFNNCNFGTMANNTTDINTSSGTLNTTLFNACSFASTTLIAGYLANLEGSEIAFQDMDGNTSKHRWYTNHGSFWSSGSGLTDTTVRTASSLALAVKPEDSTSGGAVMSVKIPASPTSIVQFYGYLYRNATFSSGVLKVDLFLPGNTTVTPDATYTLPTTTGAWLPFVLSAYNSNTTSRYATIRLTAVSSTAGAYAFLDDIYDAGTGNKVAGLDLWDNGKISPIIVASDYSSIPDQARVAVWSDTDTYGAGTKADDLANATAPSASAVADAVWDEAKSAHTTAGTYGKSVADQEILTKGLYGK